MLLNEIFPDDPSDEKAQADKQFNIGMDALKKRYAPPSPEVVAAHKARQNTNQELGRQNQIRRQRVEQALEPIAQKFKADQFDDFKREAEALVPPEELMLVNLPHVFDTYNPEKKQALAQSWAEYGNSRDAGEVQNIGPTGHKNWTGD